MLCNFRTIRPIFSKIAPKVAQNLKEKSHESSRRGKKHLRNYRAKRRGGGGFRPPPGPFRVNPFRMKTTNIYSQEEINLYCIIKLAT